MADGTDEKAAEASLLRGDWAGLSASQVGLDLKGVYPTPLVPRFSLQERDQRWAKVRALMERDGIDVIVAPPHSGTWDTLSPNVRYLTGVGGNCAPVSAVFPLDGEVTAITGPVPQADYWRAYQDWVDDVRPVFFAASQALASRLGELGLGKARVGVAGLAGLPRWPEGIVSTGMMAALEEALPEAEFVNATFLLDEARYVKSAEEIAFITQAIALVESAIDVLAAEARPGVPESVVYARMMATMVEQGSDLPLMLLWSAGSPQPPTNIYQATRRPLGAGDVIGTEIEAVWGGYHGQVTQAAVLGPVPQEYRDMFAVQQEAIRRCYEALRPGHVMADLIPIAASAAEGTDFRCELVCHARGLGDEAPMIIFATRNERMRNWPVEEGATFILKPHVRSADGARSITWGDTVVATADGARRLGSRAPEILELT